MGKLRANSEIISDKSKNPVTTSTYIKHGNQWLDDAVNNAIGAAASKADKTYVDSELTKKANKSDTDAALSSKADKSALEAINASVSVNTSNIQELSTESTVLSARMDEFTKLSEGSTTGDAELADGRVGADGKTYDNIGGAIRGQVTDLKSEISEGDSRLSEAIADADTNISDYINGIVSLEWRDGYISKVNGDILPFITWSYSKKIICRGFDSVCIYSEYPTEYNAFYNKNGDFISQFQLFARKNIITVPANAYYFCISQNNNYKDNIVVTPELSFKDFVKEEDLNLFKIANDFTFRFEDEECLEKSGNLLYFKGTIKGYSQENGNFSYSYEQLKDLFQSDVSGDYIIISNYYTWCYNIKTKALEKVYYNAIEPHHIVIVRNVDGHLVNCKLFDFITNNRISVLENPKTGVEYITDNFDEPIDRVISNQTGDSISFVMMSDNHQYQVAGDNQTHAVKSLKKVIENVEIKAVVCGGDTIIDSVQNLSYEVGYMRQMMNAYYALDCKMLPVVGNHDDCSFMHVYNTVKSTDLTDWVIKPQLMNTLSIKRSDDYIVRDEANVLGNYYYYDIPNSDIRILCLNTSDVPYDLHEVKNVNGVDCRVLKYPAYNHLAISGAQVDFVKNMLQSYTGKLIVVSHAPLYNVKGSNVPPINADGMVALLNAWKNGGTVTYTGANTDIPCSINTSFSGTHDLIGLFAGHTHYDSVNTIGGITQVTTLNCQCNKWNDSPDRELGTYSEIAFDVITVDPITKSVKLTRFGAGSDRTFTY